MKKESDPSCSHVIMVLIVLFLLYLFGQNAKEFIYNLKAVGICFGGIFLAIILLRFYFMIFPGKNEPDLITTSEKYPVRCILKETATQVPEKFHELSGTKPTSPIYLMLSITNRGVSLSPISEVYSWDFISVDNESRYRMLGDGRTGPIILAGGYSHVHYAVYQKNGDTSEGGVEKWELLPADPGPIHVEIILLSSAILKEDNLTQIVQIDPPLKIKLVVLDKDGHHDEEATRDLYNKICLFMNPHLAADYSDPMYEGYNDPPPPWHY